VTLEIVVAPGVPLPVPTGLDALVAERVRSLPRDVLLIAAGTATWRFTGDGLEPGALERAELAGHVIVDEPAAPGGLTVLGGRAVFGDVYIKLGGLTYVTPAQGKQIVEELHGKL
jgi:hypothetical protein